MNSLKRDTVTGFIFVSVLGTLSHFIYHWSGNHPLIGLFTPVNESTWEHMKLLFFPAVLYLIYISGKENGFSSNLVPALSAGILAGTFSIPIIFYTYTGILGCHLLFLDIATFYISVAAAFLIAYKLSFFGDLSRFKPLLLVMIFIVSACFIKFTYKAPGLGLFSACKKESCFAGFSACGGSHFAT